MKTLPPLFNFKQATFFLQHLFIYQNYSPNMHSNSISPLYKNLYHIMHLSGLFPPDKTRNHAFIGTIPPPTPHPQLGFMHSSGLLTPSPTPFLRYHMHLSRLFPLPHSLPYYSHAFIGAIPPPSPTMYA